MSVVKNSSLNQIHFHVLINEDKLYAYDLFKFWFRYFPLLTSISIIYQKKMGVKN